MYSEILEDRKAQTLPPELFKTWINLLALANRCEPRGVLPPVEDIAFALRMPDQDVQTQLQDLHQRGLLDLAPTGAYSPHNWAGRQPESDDAAGRMARTRANKEHVPNEFGTGSELVQPRLEADDTKPDSDAEQRRADATVAAPPPDATEVERLIIHEFSHVKGYPVDWALDLKHIRALAVDFPTVDLLAEAKAWWTYKLGKPLDKKSNPRSQFRTWCKKAAEWKQGARTGGTGRATPGRGSEQHGSPAGAPRRDRWESTRHSGAN